MKVRIYKPKDFLWTKWTASKINKISEKFLAHKKKVYAEIKSIPREKRTFENTVYALEASDYLFDTALKSLGVLLSVSSTESVRESSKKALDEISKKMVDIGYDKGIYKALLEYRDGPNYKKEKLLPEERMLLKDFLIGYRRMGFDLPKTKQKKLKEIIKKLSKLSSDFSKNLNDYHDHIIVTRGELDGLPENYINGLSRDAKGNYKVTLEYPDLFPFMSHSKSDIKRKELAEKNYRKGGIKNLLILERAIKLREERARILGYKNHVDFVTEVRMAKNSKKVRDFILGLSRKLKRKSLKEIKQLTDFKKKETKDKNVGLTYYDTAYWSERLKEKKFNINSEKIREYFPFDKVIKGTFEIYQKLFGVKFEKLKGYPVWHEDVEVYAVKEKNGGIKSYFMLDLYPRKNKYGHACANEIITGRIEGWRGEEYNAPLALMIANFPKPRPKVPSLLSHGDVETFFHEFGHVMHATLTKGRYVSQSGYNTVWDFVEAPSQMLENWVWDRRMIKLLSRHYKTGKPLPEKDLKNLLKVKNYMVAIHSMRQLALGYFDWFIHSRKNISRIDKIHQKITRDYSGISIPKTAIFPAGFGHLMGGYDAGYYSYMWSLVYASDMFTRFKREGLLNPKTGRDYRREILEVGGGREELASVKKFLGRAPNNRAFLKEIGL